MAKLEGQIDIKATAAQKELDKLLKKLDRIEKNIDDVSRSTLDPKVREQRITSLNKQLQITEASVRRLKGAKIDIQTTKPSLLSKAATNLRSLGNAAALFTGGVIAQGIAQVTTAIFNLASQASEVKKLTVGMNDYIRAQNILTKGGGLATQRDFTDQLTASTRKLVKESDSLVLVNEALNKGIATSPEQYAELAAAAAVLGQTVGKDAVTSIQSVNTALANNSKEVLENIGVVLSVAEAQEAYAAKLGKTVNQLTVLERSQAFQVIGSERIIQKAEEMGGASTLVVSGFDRMATASDSLKLALGRLFEGPVSEGLANFSDKVDTLTDNIERLPDVITAVSGTDLGLEGVSENVTRNVLEMDLTSLDEAIAKEKEYLAVAEQMGGTAASIIDANQRLADLEAERLATAEKLASLTAPQEISPNMNAGIAQALELQQQQKAQAQQMASDANERINLLKQLQNLERQGFLSTESYVDQIYNKEQSLADLRMFTEQAVESAKRQNTVNEINRLDQVAAKTQEVAQLEATIESKKVDAVASFEKRRNQFYANEAKRISELREQSLMGLVGGRVGEISGGLGDVIGEEGGASREFAENLRRLEAIARGDVGGESAQLLKESGLFDQIFGGLTDDKAIQEKAIEVFNNFKKNSIDTFGLIDIDALATDIIDNVLGGKGESIQEKVYNEIISRGVLTPEQIDQAFNITRQEFGEELDMSLVGEGERQKIAELNEEIQKLGDDGQIAIDKLGEATGDLEKQSEVWDFSLDEKIARYERILALMGMIAGTDPGVFGGVPAEGPQPAAAASPSSPDTSFSIPSSPLPTADFAAPTIATGGGVAQQSQQTQGGGGQTMTGNLYATITMPNGDILAEQVIPYIARAIA